jgi:hypothetical protein
MGKPENENELEVWRKFAEAALAGALASGTSGYAGKVANAADAAEEMLDQYKERARVAHNKPPAGVGFRG